MTERGHLHSTHTGNDKIEHEHCTRFCRRQALHSAANKRHTQEHWVPDHGKTRTLHSSSHDTVPHGRTLHSSHNQHSRHTDMYGLPNLEAALYALSTQSYSRFKQFTMKSTHRCILRRCPNQLKNICVCVPAASAFDLRSAHTHMLSWWRSHSHHMSTIIVIVQKWIYNLLNSYCVQARCM